MELLVLFPLTAPFYLNPGASGLGYIATLKLSVGHLKRGYGLRAGGDCFL